MRWCALAVAKSPVDTADGSGAGPGLFHDIAVNAAFFQKLCHHKTLLHGHQLGDGAQIVKKSPAFIQIFQHQNSPEQFVHAFFFGSHMHLPSPLCLLFSPNFKREKPSKRYL